MCVVGNLLVSMFETHKYAIVKAEQYVYTKV